MFIISPAEITQITRDMEGFAYYQISTDKLRALMQMANSSFPNVITLARDTAASGQGTSEERQQLIQALGDMALQCAQVLHVFSRMTDSEYELEAIHRAKQQIEGVTEKLP